MNRLGKCVGSRSTTSVPILDCGANEGRYFIDREFASRHCVYKFVDNLVRELQWCLTVEFEDYRSREPPETFVAVDERMVLQNGLQQSSQLGPEIGISILAERSGLWSGSGRTEKANIAYRRRLAEKARSSVR